MKRIVLAAVFLTLSFTSGQAGESQSAREFVANLYAPFETGSNAVLKHPVTPNYEPYLYGVTTPALTKLIASDHKYNKQEVPCLDGEPLINAQDWDIHEFKVKISNESEKAATAIVKFENSGDPQVMILKLVKVKSQWKIDDIYTGSVSQENSLKHMLSDPQCR